MTENYLHNRQEICCDCLGMDLYDLGTSVATEELERVVRFTCPEAKKKFFFTHTFDNHDLPCCFDSLTEAIAAAKEEIDIWGDDVMPDPDEAKEFRIINYAGNPVYKFKEHVEEKVEHSDYGVCDLFSYELVKIEEADA